MESFHMTSRRPCWCPKPVLWELNSFLMQTLSFVSINLHRCWPREWKHSIGNSMICSDTWHKYHDWYFEIEIWGNFEISRVVFVPNITCKSCYYLFILIPAKVFLIFTCRYLKLSWNAPALSQSNCRNFSFSSVNTLIKILRRAYILYARKVFKAMCVM